MSNIKFQIVFCLLSFVFCLSSCQDDSYLGGHFTTEGQGTQAKVTAVSVSEQTPAIAWSEGDVIALTTSYADTYSLNRFYACGADGRTFAAQAGVPVYIKGNGYLTAYAPVVGTESAEPVIELNTANQTAVTDYIFAKEAISRSQADVQLRFRHVHAYLHTTIKTADSEHIRKIVLSGFSHEASVDPYTWDVTLTSAAADYTLSAASDITSFDLTLIPQTVAEDAVVPAHIVLIGTNRSYELALGTITLESDKTLNMAVDVSTPEPTVAFSTDGVTWTNYEDKLTNGIDFESDTVRWSDSGKGGDVSSH